MKALVQEIASLVGATVIGEASRVIDSFAGIKDASEGALSFLSNEQYVPFLDTTEASAVLISRPLVPNHSVSPTLIVVEDAYASLALLMQYVAKTTQEHPSGVSDKASIDPSVNIPEHAYIGPYAVIEKDVQLGEGCSIYPFCYVGKDCSIGENATLYPHVILYQGTIVGARSTIHAGSVLGADGFGFAPVNGHYEKIPQMGRVVIAEDVEIGANSCIDRATMGETSIERGTKIDNLIQVGHNCRIGSDTVMAAQVGLAGSTIIGNRCRIGGQCGFAGHISVGDNTEIGAQSGVLGNISPGARLLGSPAMNVGDALHAYVLVRKLPELKRRIEELEKTINELKK